MDADRALNKRDAAHVNQSKNEEAGDVRTRLVTTNLAIEDVRREERSSVLARLPTDPKSVTSRTGSNPRAMVGLTHEFAKAF